MVQAYGYPEVKWHVAQAIKTLRCRLAAHGDEMDGGDGDGFGGKVGVEESEMGSGMEIGWFSGWVSGSWVKLYQKLGISYLVHIDTKNRTQYAADMISVSRKWFEQVDQKQPTRAG